MMVATTPSIFSVDFCLSGLMLPAGSVRTWMLSTIQASTGCPPWANLPSNAYFNSSLDGGDISLKPCPNGTTVKPASSRFLAHLDRTPPVESDLSDIKPGAKILNELLDIPVVHHVTLSRFKESLTVPQVVGDVIAGDPEFQVVFGYPKPGRDRVFVVIP